MKERKYGPNAEVQTVDTPHQSGRRGVFDEVAHRLLFEVPRGMQRHSLWGEDVVQAALLSVVEKAGDVDGGRSWNEQVMYLLRRGRGGAYDEFRRIRRGDGYSRRSDETLARLNQSIEALEQELKRPPTRAEIAREMDVPVDQLETALLSGRRLSLDRPLVETGEGDADWGDIISAPEPCAVDAMVQDESMRILTRMAFGHFSEGDSEGLDPVQTERVCYERCLEVAVDCDGAGVDKDERAARMSGVSDMFGAVHEHFGFVEPTAVTPKESFVLRAKYIHGMTNSDIAVMLGVTASRVSQILKAANQSLEARIREDEIL